MDFEDIEMLEVPEDSSVTSENQTASISGSSTESYTPKPKEYPSFQQWLAGEKDLEFQFDISAYKQSYHHTDDFNNVQGAYITKLYKILEDLASKKITAIGTEQDDLNDREQIGVISKSKDFGASREIQYKLTMINEAFSKANEAFSVFFDRVQHLVSEEDAQAYEDLSSLLDCVSANSFSVSERQRPEAIMQWINKYNPKPDNEFIDAVMYENPTPYMHSQFWTSYLGTLLSRGMFSQAVSSIQASKYEELSEKCSPLHAIIQDLCTLISNYEVLAMKGQFAEWKNTVCEFRDNYKHMKEGISDAVHVTIATQIHDLLCLISGLPKTTASFVSSWYEMFGALALYQVRDDNSVYSDYYQLAIAEKGSDVSSSLEQAFRDVIAKKYLRVILAIDSYDPATAAYVSKLFELRGFFASYYVDFIEQSLSNSSQVEHKYVSDYLLTRHAYECLEVHELVPVGIGILMTPIITYSKESQQRVREVIREFLPYYRSFTNDDMEWALTICAKLNLTDVVRKLFLSQGEKSLRDGHLYEALNMLVNCYDEQGCSQESEEALKEIHKIIWDLLFQDCLLNSLPCPDELLTNIVNNEVDSDFKIHPVIRQCIAPYAVLADIFMSLQNQSNSPKVTNDLFHLLRFRFLPKKFVPLLLAQFLPILAKNKFELPQLIIMTDLIDSFELRLEEKEEDLEELYAYAIENVPETVSHDWRVQLQKNDEKVPGTVPELLRELRDKIVRKIAMVYIGQ